jgi:hypothetical protein
VLFNQGTFFLRRLLDSQAASRRLVALSICQDGHSRNAAIVDKKRQIYPRFV